jgi:Zn-dependent protease
MDIAITLFEFVVLLFSAVLHEVSHGFEAERLGDTTARDAGRLTLNPLKHLDPMTSVLLPVLLYWATSGAFFFAAAKPVPYNPNNLKDPRSGSAKIALAGPGMNLFIAMLFGILSVLLPVAAGAKEQLFNGVLMGGGVAFGSSLEGIYFLFLIIVYINVLLAVFNLVPIPPLDGSRILFAALPQSHRTYRVMIFLERWGFFLVIAFVFFGFQYLFPILDVLFRLFAGRL